MNNTSHSAPVNRSRGFRWSRRRSDFVATWSVCWLVAQWRRGLASPTGVADWPKVPNARGGGAGVCFTGSDVCFTGSKVVSRLIPTTAPCLSELLVLSKRRVAAPGDNPDPVKAVDRPKGRWDLDGPRGSRSHHSPRRRAGMIGQPASSRAETGRFDGSRRAGERGLRARPGYRGVASPARRSSRAAPGGVQLGRMSARSPATKVAASRS
jgi:hypothetical protein